MSTQAFMEKDTLARQKIVEDIQTNFFVEAGAGSGKTTILVKRMVAMVEQGVDVRKICAITFTRAAAGEFYDRFQKQLILRSTARAEDAPDPVPGDLPAPTDLTRSRCMQALQDLDLCFMGTIDAFCNMILSEHPAKAGVPSDCQVLSEDELTAYYAKAFSDIQKGGYGPELQKRCREFISYYRKPNKEFCKMLTNIMRTRNCRHAFPPMPDKDVSEIIRSEQEKLLPVLLALLEHPEWEYTNCAPSINAWEALRTHKKRLLQPWADNALAILEILKSVEKLRLTGDADPTCLGAFGSVVFEYYKKKGEWYQFNESGPQALITELQTLQYIVTMNFLTAAAEEIARRLRKDGLLTYLDCLMYLRDTLREDAADEGKLIAHIYGRHQYFLIDEFQDTNPMQAEVFFYLTAQNPQPDWRQCIPHPGSLFIVGDPKQSIYRFRSADVDAFLSIRDMFLAGAGEVVGLTRNFRSTHKMRAWFNRVFPELLAGSQCEYEPIPLEEAPPADNTLNGSFTYRVDADHMDTEQVVQIIRRMVNNPNCLICDRGENTPRQVTYQDIMLIVPTKNPIDGFIRAFTDADIPFRVEGKVLFSQCPSLVAVTRIFAAIARPNSRQDLVGALTCQRFGYDLNALHRMKKEGSKLDLYGEHPDTDPLSQVLSGLKKLVRQSRQMSATALFTVILEELEIFKCVPADYLEYLYYALELLRSGEEGGEFASLSQAADYLESLVNDQTDIERTISLTRDENRVHIANLHKVKGLEAPIVFLANPFLTNRAPNMRVEQAEPQPNCWIFSTGHGYTDELEEEKKALLAEKLRQRYVAATRAQRVLIVADAYNKGGRAASNPWKEFAEHCQGDIFSKIPEVAIAPAEKEAVTAADIDAAAQLHRPVVVSGEASYAICLPSQIKAKGKTANEETPADAEPVTTPIHRGNAALMGTLVHSLMEAMVSCRNTAPLSQLVQQTVAEYDAQEYAPMLTRVGAVMQNGGYPQTLGAEQDILTELLTADAVYCELPFCRKDKDAIWHGIMDVVYRKGDRWYILDYKTNADARGLDDKYEDQLSAYTEAFHDLTGHTATALIYHIDI